ncbi:MAG: hypothetical protein IJ869_05500 [Clostridiales bacterium]|nr:hypothetical protein [Clostridiales bacterium]
MKKALDFYLKACGIIINLSVIVSLLEWGFMCIVLHLDFLEPFRHMAEIAGRF